MGQSTSSSSNDDIPDINNNDDDDNFDESNKNDSGKTNEFLEQDVEVEFDEDIEEETGGFNMIFSPELVRRLQGIYDDDDEDSDVENEQEENQYERNNDSDNLHQLFVEESEALKEIDRLLESVDLVEEEEKNQSMDSCANEERDCINCLQTTGSAAECEKFVEAYNQCRKTTRKHT